MGPSIVAMIFGLSFGFLGWDSCWINKTSKENPALLSSDQEKGQHKKTISWQITREWFPPHEIGMIFSVFLLKTFSTQPSQKKSTLLGRPCRECWVGMMCSFGTQPPTKWTQHWHVPRWNEWVGAGVDHLYITGCLGKGSCWHFVALGGMSDHTQPNREWAFP